MATTWSEEYDPLKHLNPMGSEVGTPPGIARHLRAGTIDPHRVQFVRVEGFTFEFHSAEQARACLDFYRLKIAPSGRLSSSDMGGGDHWEFQRWFERLPGELRREPKRLKVVAALEDAVRTLESPGTSG
jgi:hypothetical protein